MVKIIYEDTELLVVEKPAGIESQSSRKFEPDMVSEIKNYLRISTKKSTKASTRSGEPYVGVIHRLDKPVGGVMVYAKNQKAAASLSRQVQDGRMEKQYQAVVCGKPVDIVGNYVDYLLKDGKNNYSSIVDKTVGDSRRAELSYRVLGEIAEDTAPKVLSLLEIRLLTGRHHQIRVQFAGHGTPLWGDNKYNPLWGGTLPGKQNKKEWEESSPKERGAGENAERLGGTEIRPGGSLALSAVRLSFEHPGTGKRMTFSMKPQGAVFERFGG